MDRLECKNLWFYFNKTSSSRVFIKVIKINYFCTYNGYKNKIIISVFFYIKINLYFFKKNHWFSQLKLISPCQKYSLFFSWYLTNNKTKAAEDTHIQTKV